MCLRPYPVYIKMWAEAKERVMCELYTVLFVLKETEQLFYGFDYLVWPKLEEWASKKYNKLKKKD